MNLEAFENLKQFLEGLRHL